jgi:hypothetical protein
MAYAGVILAAVGMVGGFVQGYQQYEAGKAAKKAGYENEKIVLRNTYARERAIRRRGRLEQGYAETAVAKSGVEMSGSAIELMALNASEIEREAIDTRIRGQQEAAYIHAEARNAKVAGGRAFAASFLLAGGQAAAGAYSMRPASPAATDYSKSTPGNYIGARGEGFGGGGWDTGAKQ